VLANSLIGDIVPINHGDKSKAQFAYLSRFIPGNIWPHGPFGIEGDLKVCSQVGAIIARCVTNIDSTSMVEHYIIPRLEKIVSKEKMPEILRTRIKSLIPLAPNLKALPLSICHADINKSNVIVDDDANIVGSSIGRRRNYFRSV
jgi:hypothetical protein